MDEHADNNLSQVFFTACTIAAMAYFGIPLINATIGPELNQWLIDPISDHLSSLFESSASNAYESATAAAPATQYGLVQSDGSVLAPGCHVHLDGVVHCGTHGVAGDATGGAAVESIANEPITPPSIEW